MEVASITAGLCGGVRRVEGRGPSGDLVAGARCQAANVSAAGRVGASCSRGSLVSFFRNLMSNQQNTINPL